MLNHIETTVEVKRIPRELWDAHNNDEHLGRTCISFKRFRLRMLRTVCLGKRNAWGDGAAVTKKNFFIVTFTEYYQLIKPDVKKANGAHFKVLENNKCLQNVSLRL
jgi:hypothetical protein